MRNKVFGKQLSRNRKSREALFVGLTKNVIEHGSIITTLAKAKAIRVELDKLMQYVSDGSLSAKRNAAAYLRNDRKSVDKLFSLGLIAKSRVSGFSSITRLPTRRGDNADLAKIGWVTEEQSVEESDKSQVTSGK